ncbi:MULTISPECIES: hypothetical protein [Bacteroides]|jgi:hypothetical protein|uniref:Uncharacterized protein n=2 Tax=Bacteroides clarus TaxID=626929 RepID=A0A1Y4JXQ6_9BACE|nr:MULTISPECIES: hypothetical protein [Bacteroides]OKY99473.1 MAG: hypothetical protein BHV73_08065 [Bacteroides sp. 44_46]OUP36426.1 hypothetical protein B5F24_00615 [Bacteroides clarus]CDB81570.1 conserved domain protein [Bacteroides clarus CAG:160]HJF99459.1 hypothetical protein [Bacteroides clarus]
MDKNYWKEAYKEYWEISSKKEIFVKELIESKTGFKTLEVGLGAGSEDFLSGSASDYGLTKGDADLYVIVPDTYVEVTGPNISVKPEDTLWIRPDKVKNSFNKQKAGKGKLHVIVHIAKIKPNGNIAIRVIMLNKTFFEACRKKEFPLIQRNIRGLQETYLELPPKHETIISFEEFIALLKQNK